MAEGTKHPLNTVGFGVKGEVSDARVSWPSWATMFIAISRRLVRGLATFAHGDLSFISIHKEVQEIDSCQLFPSTRVIGYLALGEQNTGIINIEYHGLMITVVLEIL